MGDTFGKGRWIRRVWSFLLDGFQSSEDVRRFDRPRGEWNSYRERQVGCLTRGVARLNVFLADFY